MSCKFTGSIELIPDLCAIGDKSGKLKDSLTRGRAEEVSTGNHVNLQDSLTSGCAEEVSTGNHVNLQDSLTSFAP